MKLQSGQIYHIYNRGNNRQRLFYERDNYYYFLSKVRRYLSPHCDILAYCLMPNHFHFLIHANQKTNLLSRRKRILLNDSLSPGIEMTRFSKGIQLLLSSYAKGMNKKYSRSGSLFRQNTKSKLTSSENFLNDYSLQCFMYIHNNPVSAGLVQFAEEWEFSSMREFMGFKTVTSICNVEIARKLLNLDLNDIQYLSGMEVPTEVIRKIFK